MANLVLDELDQELERRHLRFVRYADDCLVFVRSRRAARRVMASITRFLTKRMRLVINEEKSAIRRQGQIEFLGFRLGSNRAGAVAVRISKQSYRRLLQRTRELTPRTWGRSLDSCFYDLNRYLRGWMAHFRLCTIEGSRVFGRMDSHTRRRIRAIIIRQKKKRAHLFRHLIAKGVSGRNAAGTAYSSRGFWFRSNTRGIDMAYRNSWFQGRLVSLHAEWLRLNPPPLVSRQTVLFAPETLDPKSRM